MVGGNVGNGCGGVINAWLVLRISTIGASEEGGGGGVLKLLLVRLLLLVDDWRLISVCVDTPIVAIDLLALVMILLE